MGTRSTHLDVLSDFNQPTIIGNTSTGIAPYANFGYVEYTNSIGVGKYNGGAKRTIDAAGRVVAPGFIDHHTHFDPQALWDPYCGSSVQNGHTTILVGQCGQVIAPARPDDHDWYLEFFSDAE